MKAFLITLIFLSLQANAQVNSRDLVTKINNALNTILENVLTDKLDVVILKDDEGKYVVDKNQDRVTEIKIDPKETDINENKLKFGARLTLNSARWAKGIQSGVGLYAYGKILSEKKEAKLGFNAKVDTDTVAFLKFVLKATVDETWKDGLPDNADEIEKKVYNSIVSASNELSSIKEFGELLTSIQNEALKYEKNKGGSIEKKEKEAIESIKVISINYDEEKKELLVSYDEEKDPNKPAGKVYKNLTLSKSQVLFTDKLTSIDVEVTFKDISDKDLEYWEQQKAQGMGFVQQFLPALEDPDQAKGITRGIKEFVDNGIKFLTEENTGFDLF